MDDEPKYNGWLVSNSFFKRLLAVTGYALIGYFSFIFGIVIITRIFGV